MKSKKRKPAPTRRRKIVEEKPQERFLGEPMSGESFLLILFAGFLLAATTGVFGYMIGTQKEKIKYQKQKVGVIVTPSFYFREKAIFQSLQISAAAYSPVNA